MSASSGPAVKCKMPVTVIRTILTASAIGTALNTITTLVFTRLGKVHGNLMVDLRATNDKLVDRAIRILIDFCPELDRTQSHAMLNAAGHRLPVAIVMARLGIDRDAALARLEACGHRLRDALRRG